MPHEAQKRDLRSVTPTHSKAIISYNDPKHVMSEEKTSNSISRSERERMTNQRSYPRSTYRTIVRRLLDQSEDPEPLSPETIADIQASLDEIRRGEFVTHEELKRELGIE